MINTLFCTDRLTATTPHSRPTWPRSGRCLGWTDIPLSQGPLLERRNPLPGIILLWGLFQASLGLLWSHCGSSGVHLDSAEVSLAQEDHRLRAPNQAEDTRLYLSGSFEKINILVTLSLFGSSNFMGHTSAVIWQSTIGSIDSIGLWNIYIYLYILIYIIYIYVYMYKYIRCIS